MEHDGTLLVGTGLVMNRCFISTSPSVQKIIPTRELLATMPTELGQSFEAHLLHFSSLFEHCIPSLRKWQFCIHTNKKKNDGSPVQRREKSCIFIIFCLDDRSQARNKKQYWGRLSFYPFKMNTFIVHLASKPIMWHSTVFPRQCLASFVT